MPSRAEGTAIGLGISYPSAHRTRAQSNNSFVKNSVQSRIKIDICCALKLQRIIVLHTQITVSSKILCKAELRLTYVVH